MTESETVSWEKWRIQRVAEREVKPKAITDSKHLINPALEPPEGSKPLPSHGLTGRKWISLEELAALCLVLTLWGTIPTAHRHDSC